MADEQQKFVWVKPQQPTPQLYTNFVHTSWTLYDVRFLLGQLVPKNAAESKDFVVEEQGSVTIPWAQVKNLKDFLSGLIAQYEQVNGEIKPVKIAQAPPAPPPPTAQS